MWDETKRLVYLGVYQQYGCGSVWEIDQHLRQLNECVVGERSAMVVEAIAFDRDRLLELRKMLVDIDTLRDDGPLYIHDVIGGAA